MQGKVLGLLVWLGFFGVFLFCFVLFWGVFWKTFSFLGLGWCFGGFFFFFFFVFCLTPDVDSQIDWMKELHSRHSKYSETNPSFWTEEQENRSL